MIKKEKKPKKEEAEEYKGEMGTYKITGLAEYTDEEGNKMGELEIGSIQSLPTQIGDKFIEDGVAEKVEDTGKNPGETETEKSEDTVPAKTTHVRKTFHGQEVISDGHREVEGKKYRHVKIADGSTYDLSEDEYQFNVKPIVE